MRGQACGRPPPAEPTVQTRAHSPSHTRAHRHTCPHRTRLALTWTLRGRSGRVGGLPCSASDPWPWLCPWASHTHPSTRPSAHPLHLWAEGLGPLPSQGQGVGVAAAPWAGRLASKLAVPALTHGSDHQASSHEPLWGGTVINFFLFRSGAVSKNIFRRIILQRKCF